MTFIKAERPIHIPGAEGSKFKAGKGEGRRYFGSNSFKFHPIRRSAKCCLRVPGPPMAMSKIPSTNIDSQWSAALMPRSWMALTPARKVGKYWYVFLMLLRIEEADVLLGLTCLDEGEEEEADFESLESNSRKELPKMMDVSLMGAEEDEGPVAIRGGTPLVGDEFVFWSEGMSVEYIMAKKRGGSESSNSMIVCCNKVVEISPVEKWAWTAQLKRRRERIADL
jgi:hypothetical protein